MTHPRTLIVLGAALALFATHAFAQGTSTGATPGATKPPGSAVGGSTPSGAGGQPGTSSGTAGQSGKPETGAQSGKTQNQFGSGSQPGSGTAASGSSAAGSGATTGSGSTTGTGSAAGSGSMPSGAGSTGAGVGMSGAGQAGAAKGTPSLGGNRDQVKQVQEALKDKGHDPGPIDGVMGPKTQDALRAFQKDQNLPSTGRMDTQTLGALGVSGAGDSATKKQ